EVTSELSGNAKLYYETIDIDGGNEGLFHQKAATTGQALLSIESKGKLSDKMGYGAKYTAVDTLGLENNLVSGVRVQGAGSALNTAHWAEKAFITYQMGKTTAKIGRQHLNTPLAFTEKWNIAANSFDAAVLINSNIENVTLIGAYVGRGNGSYFGKNADGVKGSGTLAVNGKFDTYVADGAYAVAALIKPMKDLGINAWYYNVQKVADAAWLDANYNVGGVKLGAIYAQMMPKASGADDTTAFALKAGSKVGAASLFAAYSSISDDGSLPVANTATGFKKTKLPTAGVYNDGVIVAQPGSQTFKLKASVPVGPVKLTGQYISTANDVNEGKDADEFDIIIGTKVAGLNVKALYMNRTFKNNNASGSLGVSDHQNVRIIVNHKF
ncbi:MAG: OprD family outer membrane porin, partial [Sulfurovaceae bacterium]|nr:OprD family outer membrane porin [Sulfurovaceae bacterium]